MVNTVFI